ncbi:MAG TPA: hypothetical protein VEB86_19395 [Chryseosolibacter sp.]|nr:hypothetical protein [Chryseosolibacter sp.]
MACISILWLLMIREFINIEHFKNLTENLLNCWLSYSVSQPIQLDLTILVVFLLQYIGFGSFPVTFEIPEICAAPSGKSLPAPTENKP